MTNPTIETTLDLPEDVAAILRKFDGIEAKFWDIKGDDVLSHEDPVEALIDFADSLYKPGSEGTAEQQTRNEIRDFTCGYDELYFDAYQVEKISDSFIEGCTERLQDQLAEWFDEDYGPIEFTDEPSISSDIQKKFFPEFKGLVKRMCEASPVWRCEVTQQVVITADEAIVLLKHFYPEGFAE